MIKITTRNQIAVLSLPIEVKDRITKIIKILEESYDRTIYHDEGGFVVVLENIADLKMDENLAHRYLNEGFSGGEKKRNEILQMKLLQPKFALLDEIDSGLDVDALKIVANAIGEMKSNDFACVMVSHYERLFELVPPSHVHVLVNGRIILSGGKEVVEKIDQEGYEWVKELGVEVLTEEKKPILLESCANKERMKTK